MFPQLFQDINPILLIDHCFTWNVVLVGHPSVIEKYSQLKSDCLFLLASFLDLKSFAVPHKKDYCLLRALKP